MKRGRLMRALGAGYTLLLVGFLLLPAIAILPASLGESEFIEFPPRNLTLDWYRQVLTDDDWLASAALSLRVAICAALVTTVLALMFGIVQFRFRSVPKWSALLILLPLWVPHVILATGLFTLLLPAGLLGTESMLVLANASLALPLSATLMLNAFSTIDPTLWTAANSLGARPLTVVRTIILPLVGLSAIMSMILAFQSTWDETIFALFIGPVLVPVLSARMYSYVHQSVTPAIAAVAAMVTAITLLAGLLFAMLRSLQQRRRQLARDLQAD